jgi:uncharacterized membrane protein YfcA
MILLHSWLFIFIISGAALLAGTMDTLAGGGGLITVPLLLLSGLPAPLVLGTNKLQAVFGSGTAAFTLIKKSNLSWRDLRLAMALSLIAAAIGTLLVLQLHHNDLKKIIPIPLIIVLIYLLRNPTSGIHVVDSKYSPRKVYGWSAIIYGFYDGFLGPGTGTFWAVTLVHFLGLDLRTATIRAKLFNFLSNIAAFMVFFVYGMVSYRLAIGMAIGQFVGAKIGSHLVLKHDTKFIRFALMSISGLLLIVLLYEQYLS